VWKSYFVAKLLIPVNACLYAWPGFQEVENRLCQKR
jgi:hypothetical protein